MPSELAAAPTPTLGDQALAQLDPRVQAFHSAVATAEEEVRTYVMHQRGASSFADEQALVELGPLAIGKIDPERFARLLGHMDDGLTPEAFDVLDRADAILTDFSVSMDLHRVSLEPGGDLRDAVKDALAHVGRVFGASRAIELARAGIFDPDKHGHLLGPLPFRLWNRAERQLAPPLVIELQGDDCLPAGLGEFLDGTVTLILATSGPTTPAPLARLITPGTMVIQTADPADLAAVSRTEHPAVALLFDQARPEQAHFVHDPDASGAPWGRLTVNQMPDDAEVGRGRRAPTWLEEIVHLRSLATRPGPDFGSEPASGVVVGDGPDGEVAAEVTSADKLAAWLLTQTDLEGV
jgi:hypothetical protein